MPYQNNIPRPTDQLNVSQGNIQTNFLEIYNWVAINHEQFDTANAGKHKQVTLPINVAPTPTAANEVNIYSRVSANTNKPEIVWQNQNAGTIVEMTAGEVEPSIPGPFRNGWSRLPSNLLIKWGIGQINAFNVPTVTNYPLNINGIVAPVFTGVFTIFLTPMPTVGFTSMFLDGTVFPFTTASFTCIAQGGILVNPPTPMNFSYLAIGV